MFIPLFGILKFVFYFGWLNVAETLINPFGEDDEDFDVNYLINRELYLSPQSDQSSLLHQEPSDRLPDGGRSLRGRRP